METQADNPEQKRQVAGEIYGKLQSHRGKVSLSGFNNGEVIYPETARRIKIARLGIPADYEKEMYQQRGFTDEDMASGITAIIESEFLNPDYPRVPFKKEPQLRYLNVSGTGKVVEGDREKPFHPAQLDKTGMDALEKVSQLSMIPRQILKTFGSYEAFKKTLGDRDMKGIDTTEFTPMSILYNGGLNEFVRALELGKLDTSLHALKDSLDASDHFTKLFETLEQHRQNE